MSHAFQNADNLDFHLLFSLKTSENGSAAFFAFEYIFTEYTRKL